MNDLGQARIHLLKAVQDLPEDALHACSPGGWSILHVLEHLYLTERAIIKGIRHALSVSSSDPFPQKPIEAILDRSQKVKSPEFAEPKGLFTGLEHAVTSLGASRAELEILLASIEHADALRKHGFRHPYFGMLSIEQWLEVLPLHERRHLAQIEEMKQSFSSDVRPE